MEQKILTGIVLHCRTVAALEWSWIAFPADEQYFSALNSKQAINQRIITVV